MATDAERLLLGTVLIDDTRLPEIATVIASGDFGLEKHRRIFSAMIDMAQAGQRIDRVTLAETLQARRELESVDGISYLVELDAGMPRIENVDGYARIVKDKSLKRSLIFTAQRLIDEAMLDEDASPDLVKRGAEDLIRLGEELPKSGLVQIRDIIANAGGFQAFITPRQERGVRTGFSTFDDMTGGLQPGELSILAARPSMGKTALALNIAANAARDRKRVAVFSLEMLREALFSRLLSSASRVDAQKIRSGYYNREERQRLEEARISLESLPLYIDDTPALGLMDMVLKIRQLRANEGVDLVIVDYLQLMQPPMRGKKSQENRNLELGALTRGLKMAASDAKIPILVLSQLSRAPEQREDKRPRLSDLRESGAIEQDADVVAFVFRDEVYRPDRLDLKGLADLILAKQRNGPIGTAKLVFIKEFTRFENRAASADDYEPSED
jgi:replicative DNA helicase